MLGWTDRRGLRSNTSRAARVLTVLAALLGPLAVPRPAIAQQSASADPARQAFERGIAALQENRFGDAVLAFEQSYRAREVPIVLYNLGLAYRGVGRAREAVQAFERYILNPDPRADERRLAAIREELQRLRATIVRLTLRTDPPTATVTIDGRAPTISGGVVLLDAGAHHVEVSAPGRRTERRDLTVAAGQQLSEDVTLQPEAQTARLHVEPSVPTAVVFIDGREAGTGSTDVDLEAGTHQIEVRSPGRDTFRRTVRLAAGGSVRVDAALAGGSSAGVFVGIGIGAGALVVGGAVLGTVLFLTRPTAQPYAAPWGNFPER